MNLTSDVLDILACPGCRSQVSLESDGLVCTHCGHYFKIAHGLLDLCCPGLNMPELLKEDYSRAQMLRLRSPELSVPELIRLCYKLPSSRNLSSLDISVDYVLSGGQRMADTFVLFKNLARQNRWYLPEHGTVLDLGCGVGLGTGYLTKSFDKVFAVNPAWDEMVIAERVNRERFGEQMVLVRTVGEHLPFRDDSFDLVCALDIMEHVAQPHKVLKEVERTLKPGGMFIFDSSNQYNIFAPDGHVQLKFMGFIPEAMREPYVRWRTGGKMSWIMRNVHPVSYWTLNRYLKQLKDCDFRFRKFVPAGEAFGWRGRLVQSVPGMRFLAKWVFLMLGINHHVIVKKKQLQPRIIVDTDMRLNKKGLNTFGIENE